jgi:hypothetical protein
MPRTTTTRKAPTGGKSTRASQTPDAPPKGTTRQRGTSKDGAKAKANRFDAIASAVAAGDDDLARQLQDSLSQAKAKGGKPQSDAKVDAKPTSTYKGRPTSNVETIAQRAKESGLRPRRTADGNFDVDGIATRLRATPAAVREWLGSRNAKPTAPAKPAKPAAPAKPAKPEAAPKAPSIRLRHVWVDREPDWLKGRVLVYSYTVDPTSGHVTSQLQAIHDANGVPVPNFKDYPADFRPVVETLGNGRKLVLKDRTTAGLETWLAKEGLTEQQ